MSRDATAWSVKGVDQATRDIARRAAAAAGMTIGEWIDHAIKSDSANRGIPVPAERDGGAGAGAPPRADGIRAETVEAIFSRISDGERLFEARLRPIGYALKDVAERVVALEREAERLPPPTAPAALAADPVATPVEPDLAQDPPAEEPPAEDPARPSARPAAGAHAPRADAHCVPADADTGTAAGAGTRNSVAGAAARTGLGSSTGAGPRTGRPGALRRRGYLGQRAGGGGAVRRSGASGTDADPVSADRAAAAGTS